MSLVSQKTEKERLNLWKGSLQNTKNAWKCLGETKAKVRILEVLEVPESSPLGCGDMSGKHTQAGTHRPSMPLSLWNYDPPNQMYRMHFFPKFCFDRHE